MMRVALFKALTGCVVLTVVLALATNVEARHRRCCGYGGYAYGGWSGGYSYAQPVSQGGSACSGVTGGSYGGSTTGMWDGQGAYGQGAYGQTYGTQSTFGAQGTYGTGAGAYGGTYSSAYGPQGGINGQQQNANNAPPPPPP